MKMAPFPLEIQSSLNSFDNDVIMRPTDYSDSSNTLGRDVSGNANFTDDGARLSEYLAEHLGLRHRSAVESAALTAVYCAILITGVVGNVCTCLVVALNVHMHTATNYYLFSLAVSDALTLVLGLPPELYTIWEAYPWRFGQPYCLFKTFLTEMTSSASILTITAFTVERYVAICHPLRAQALSTLSRAVKTIAAVWIMACLSAIPYPLHTRTFYYVEHPTKPGTFVDDSLICNIPIIWQLRMRYVFQVSTFLLFVLPVLLITCLYVLIGLKLRRSRAASQSLGLAPKPAARHNDNRTRPMTTTTTTANGGRGRAPQVDNTMSTTTSTIQQQAECSGGSRPYRAASGTPTPRKPIVRMLVAVVVAFVICWAPFHAQRLMTIYIQEEQWTKGLLESQSLLFYISGILFFVSSTVNPILYNVMSLRYRKAFRDTILLRFCGRRSSSSASRWSLFNQVWTFSTNGPNAAAGVVISTPADVSCSGLVSRSHTGRTTLLSAGCSRQSTLSSSATAGDSEQTRRRWSSAVGPRNSCSSAGKRQVVRAVLSDGGPGGRSGSAVGCSRDSTVLTTDRSTFYEDNAASTYASTSMTVSTEQETVIGSCVNSSYSQKPLMGFVESSSLIPSDQMIGRHSCGAQDHDHIVTSFELADTSGSPAYCTDVAFPQAASSFV